MDLKKQFEEILEKEDKKKGLDFVLKLSPKDRKAFAPILLKIAKPYHEYKEIIKRNAYGNESRQYKIVGSDEQLTILCFAGFVCCDLKKFQNNFRYLLNPESEPYLDTILEKYCPSWFDAFIKEANYFNYDRLIKFYDKKYITLSPEQIVGSLPQYVFEHRQEDGRFRVYFIPEKLKNYPQTFDKHIWSIFEIENNIHWKDHYYYFMTDNNFKDVKDVWKNIFKTYTESGDLDRQRVLRESLLTTTRNFNKNLTGWFVDLFSYLEPTEEELMNLQNEMAGALNSPLSKPVNSVLKIYKKIVLKKGFDHTVFMDAAPMLLASETKGTINSTLMILDKLAKKQPKLHSEICELAAQAFFHNHDDIQTRAAKLIAKHGDVSDEILKENLAVYRDGLLSSARGLLTDFITEKEEAEVIEFFEKSQPISLDNFEKIEVPETIDDLVFFASQALNSIEPFHFDLLPAALNKLKNQFSKKEVIDKFEPAFQRVYKVLFEANLLKSYSDHLLATFFMNFGQLLIRRYPAETTWLEKMNTDGLAKDDANSAWEWYRRRIIPLKNWKGSNSAIYQPMRAYLVDALDLISSGSNLPLVSTPTHAPHWIDPLIFCQRLSDYQKAGRLPSEHDLQLGVGRLFLKNTEAALTFAKKELQPGELQNLVLYVLDKNAQPKSPFNKKAVWFQAYLAKGNFDKIPQFEKFSFSKKREQFFGEVEWKIELEIRSSKVRKLGKWVETSTPWFTQTIKLPGIIETTKDKIINFFTGEKKEGVLFQNAYKFGRWIHSEQRDVFRFVAMTPNNPEYLYAVLINKILNDKEPLSEDEKRMVKHAVESLLNLINPFGKMSHLLLANGMTYSDKTTRLIAGEVWLKAIKEQSIRPAMLGQMLGKITGIGFAPMKRLTDLISTNLFGNGKKHTLALKEMMISILLEIPDKPVTGTKKLLEIFLEVLHSTKSKLPEQLNEKLEAWKNSSSMKKVICALNELSY